MSRRATIKRRALLSESTVFASQHPNTLALKNEAQRLKKVFGGGETFWFEFINGWPTCNPHPV